MTNQEYTFDPIKIKDKFSIKECFLLNDWEAIAYSYDFIKDSVEYIKKGEPFNQNRLFVGPGTGLGAALSINNQTVLPTEIGNTTNASSLLQKNFNLNSEDNLNLEKIISGTAIASIYNLKTGNTISSEKIFEKFIKNDADAVFVINGFLKSLAETLSDLSLTYSSGNGILLAGSLIRSLYPYIDKKAFIENFLANKYQSHKKMLELVSIGVITKERTPLYGNLGFYKNLNKS